MVPYDTGKCDAGFTTIPNKAASASATKAFKYFDEVRLMHAHPDIATIMKSGAVKLFEASI
ncbi:hypothetical protein CCR75_008499 [Bremia lactucae]|uniref:Uncharacterized protein n=1 Tax=Bremia lactucae TaxID=4779 RepID=A0A976FLV1_BRELC|nr:hypothetical protein CCR75_008499 [Bremia lactucae]